MSDTIIPQAERSSTKQKVVKMRVSTAEFDAISAAARASGMTVSAFVRSLSLEGAGVRPCLTDQDRSVFSLLLDDMRAIGVNLNQVARALNSNKAVHDEEIHIHVSNVQKVAAHTLLELRSLAKRSGQKRRGEI